MLLRKSWGTHQQFRELLITFWDCVEKIKRLKNPTDTTPLHKEKNWAFRVHVTSLH
jgi:hypothetical protein